MKHAVILLDGMADYPIPSLGEKTPLAYADTPNMDYMFQNGWGGMVKNVPPGLAPESAVANLSVLGYDPETVFTGRSPLEAASMGVVLKDTDITARCNLVTLSDEPNYEDKTILDYCADEIGSAEARELVFALNEHNREKDMHFYPGISYRNLMVWNNGPTDLELVPPHDITGKPIAGYLPANARLLDVMRQSHTLLKDHPVNLDRIKKGLRPANSVWFWGAGKKNRLTRLYGKVRQKGCCYWRSGFDTGNRHQCRNGGDRSSGGNRKLPHQLQRQRRSLHPCFPRGFRFCFYPYRGTGRMWS